MEKIIIGENMEFLFRYTAGLMLLFVLVISIGVPVNNCIKSEGKQCDFVEYWITQLEK